jgi:hypothetical protein
VYQQQQQQEQEQDAENPFLDPPFSRIKNKIKTTRYLLILQKLLEMVARFLNREFRNFLFA